MQKQKQKQNPTTSFQAVLQSGPSHFRGCRIPGWVHGTAWVNTPYASYSCRSGRIVTLRQTFFCSLSVAWGIGKFSGETVLRAGMKPGSFQQPGILQQEWGFHLRTRCCHCSFFCNCRPWGRCWLSTWGVQTPPVNYL